MRRVLRSRRVLVVVGVVAAGLVIGVSTSFSQPSSRSNATASAATGKQVVRVFGMGVETQPALGALFPTATMDTTEPALAAKEINKSPSSKVTIQYTFCDSTGTPAGSVACAKQATSPTGCGGKPCDVALQVGDPNDNESVPLVAKAGMPIVSGGPSTTQAAATSNNFCISSGVAGLFGGMGYVLKKLGAHKVGIVSLLRPDAVHEDDVLTASLIHQGLQVTGTTVIPPTTVSPDAAITSVMTGGANGLAYGVVGPVGPALGYAEQTYPGVKIALSDISIAKSFFAGVPNSVLNGVGVSGWNQPATATRVPGIAQFVAAGGLAAAPAVYSGDDFSIQDWLGTRFIANVADTVSGKITPASMLHALKTAENVNMYGIMPPWNASDRGKGGAVTCSPYNVIVAETLQNQNQVADNQGVFINATTGKVAYIDPGFKAP